MTCYNLNLFTKRHVTRVIYWLTVQTLPDGLKTQLTPPDTTQTGPSCLVCATRLQRRIRKSRRAPSSPRLLRRPPSNGIYTNRPFGRRRKRPIIDRSHGCRYRVSDRRCLLAEYRAVDRNSGHFTDRPTAPRHCQSDLCVTRPFNYAAALASVSAE